MPMDSLIIVIERARIEDAEEILNLQKLAFQSQAEIYNDFNLPPLTQRLEEMKLDFQSQIVLKAVADRRIVGSVRASMNEGTCYIERLIVQPDVQNQGIGTKLMGEIERAFSEAERFKLFTGHKSKRSIHLYQKLGYQITRTENITGGLSLVHMEKYRY